MFNVKKLKEINSENKEINITEKHSKKPKTRFVGDELYNAYYGYSPSLFDIHEPIPDTTKDCRDCWYFQESQSECLLYQVTRVRGSVGCIDFRK